MGSAGRQQQPAGAIERTAGLLPPAPAGGDQRAEVADRAAADEHAAGRGRQAGQVGDPPQRLVLGEDRAAALQPRSAVDARRADDEVEQDRRVRRGRRHERQEARMVDGDARRREHLGEHAQRLERRRCPSRRDRRPGQRRQLVGRPRAVERWRVEVDALNGVAHDRFGERPRRVVRVEHQRSVVASVGSSASSLPSSRCSASTRQRLAQDGRGDAAARAARAPGTAAARRR